MYSKVIYLILIAGLEWGAVTCSKGGAGTGSVTAPVDINSCSDETLIADPGGKYYNYCDNPITLNGQDSCAKAGVENIQWNFGENYKGVSGVKTLTPTLSYSCVQGGSGKERYDILLTIRDALGQQASGGTVIILDEKGLLQFASDTAQAKEGSGAIAVEMNVSNHNQAKRFTLNNIGGFPPMTVDYFTVDGTATAPGDYQAIEGTLSFAYGEKSKTLSIPIINDSEYEGDEYFFLKLKNSTNATIEDVQIMCVISDPDPEPTATPTVEPTATPTAEPTATPTPEPTATPTVAPTATPTVSPSPTPASA
ncbi:MAG: hypothetical protein GY801_33985, partial [bacterium]|nr:hypothetical protein [bacterium]